MRIRNRLLILVLAVLAPAFLAAAFGIGYVYTEEQKHLQQSIRETTRALSNVLDEEMSKRESVLRTLAASPDIDQKNFENFYKHASAIASAANSTIVLSAPSGEQLLNTRAPYGKKDLPKLAPATDLRDLYGADATVVSNLFQAPLSNQPFFSVQVPVKRNGRLLYYLAIGTPASTLQSLFTDQRLPSGWIGTVLDRKGVVVARNMEIDKYIGKQVSAGFSKQFGTNIEGFYEAKSLSGVPVFAFFSRAEVADWVFVVNVPKSEILHTAITATIFMSIVSILLLALAVIGALVLARNTARPIEVLRSSAERLGRGDPIPAQITGFTEIDEVSTVMARASEDIINANAELELRVAKAVAIAEESQRTLHQGQKLEALGRLTGGIAHDFNNVLQTLTTGLQMALLTSRDPHIRPGLESCQHAVRRAVELTRKLMAFGRVQDARFETTDIRQQIVDMIPMLKGGLRSDITFRLELGEQLWPVKLDPLQFELALLNLTMNARDAMPHGGFLHLEGGNETITAPAGELNELPPGDYVRLSLIDSGEGMSPEVLSKALEPFFTTKSVARGSGMGLSQAYGFAKQSNGTLVLHSEPGKGTTAVLYLPRDQHPVLPVKIHESLPATATSGTVLFVEDDPLVRDVVAPALEAAGFRILVAPDGENAIEILVSGVHVDFVFSDIVMPGRINGINLAEIVQFRFPHIRVVLATGYSDRRVSLTNVRTIAKPYDVATIINALDEESKRQNPDRKFS